MSSLNKNMQKKGRRTSTSSNTPRVDAKAVTVAVSTAANTTGAITLLNGIAPGTDIDQRLGRAVIMDELQLILTDNVTAGSGIDQYHRLMLVLDRQPNGAALAILDVLDVVATNSHPNLANRSRFLILKDELHPLNAAAEPGSFRSYRWQFPLRTRITFNAGVAGTVADIATNSLYFICIGSAVAGVTAGACGVNGRLFFRNSV